MAAVSWIGVTSTDVGTDSNYSSGADPASGDTVTWGTITPFGMGSGTFANAIHLNVTEGAGTATSRDVGTAASPLTLSITLTTGVASFANRGNVYVTSGGTVAIAKFQMPNGGTAVLSGGTWTSLRPTNVKVQVGASAVVTNILSAGSDGEVATNATDLTSFRGSGKWTFNSRDIDDAWVHPEGILIMAGTSALDSVVYISKGGTFNHQSSGTVAAADIQPGSLYTVQGNPSASATLTLATIWTGGELLRASAGFTLTVTTFDFIGPESVAGGLPS